MTIYRGMPGTEPIYDLAEGIIWDDQHQVVRWVDIWTGRVFAGELRGNEIVVLESTDLGQTVGAVALADDGGLLVAAARGLATISPTGTVSIGPDLLGDRTGVRFNGPARVAVPATEPPGGASEVGMRRRSVDGTADGGRSRERDRGRGAGTAPGGTLPGPALTRS